MKLGRVFVVLVILLIIAGSIYFFINKKQKQTINSNFKLYDEQVAVIDELVLSGRETKTTNGVTHNIELSELKTLGASQDEIPPINSPKFLSVVEADKTLADDEPGIAVSIGKINRFYPYRILVWHEIVNDIVGDQRILITYSPLTLTSIVFDPNIDEDRVIFGNTGKLWRAGLVMYDKKTDSYWSQLTGEAIVGEKTGKRLPMIPSDQLTFGIWKKYFADGQVLSEETGNKRFYGESPYDYFVIPDIAYDFIDYKDSRLPKDASIAGVSVNGQTRAYSIQKIKQLKKFEDEFAGRRVIVEYQKDLDVVRLYEIVGSAKIRVSPIFAPWGIWSAVYPTTELNK